MSLAFSCGGGGVGVTRDFGGLQGGGGAKAPYWGFWGGAGKGEKN